MCCLPTAMWMRRRKTSCSTEAAIAPNAGTTITNSIDLKNSRIRKESQSAIHRKGKDSNWQAEKSCRVGRCRRSRRDGRLRKPLRSRKNEYWFSFSSSLFNQEAVFTSRVIYIEVVLLNVWRRIVDSNRSHNIKNIKPLSRVHDGMFFVGFLL